MSKKNFVTFLLLGVSLLSSGQAFSVPSEAFVGPMTYGHCGILFPLLKDKSGAQCKHSYGILYDGYLLSDTPCAETQPEAVATMLTLNVCHQERVRGQCEVLFPYVLDRDSRTCYGQFGLSADRALVGQYPQSCFPSMEDAIQAMQVEPLCN